MTQFIRKRDGARYTCDLVPRAWPNFSRRGPSYLLRPVWEGRTHYKTVAAFDREFKRAD
jgi:hypothetical protein